MTQTFADAFALRIRMFHALHARSEALSKKAFEYALEGAAIDAGFTASVAASATTPGADIVLCGEGFSIKTEAAAKISRSHITISKLMESAWTKNCKTVEDFLVGIHQHVLPRVLQPDRTLVWRCFSRLSGATAKAEYELVEIPHHLLAAIGKLTEEDFSAITSKGGTTANVVLDGRSVFALVFDGSDNKLTIRKLAVKNCTLFGSWTLGLPPNAPPPPTELISDDPPQA